MKKLVKAMVSMLMIMMLVFQSQTITQAAYDNYDWSSTLRVGETEAKSVVDAMKKYASTYQISSADRNRTVGELMEYFIFESSIAPYKVNHRYFPDYGYYISSYSDGEVSAIFQSGMQCYAHANYVESAAYGTHGLKITAESIPSSYSADDLRTFFLLYVQPGEHMLWSYQHSAAFVLATSDGVYFLQRLYTGEVVLSYCSYVDMSSYLINRNVEFYVYNAYSGVNTILPSFNANVQDGILTVEPTDYACDFYVKAGFDKSNIKKLQEISGLVGASLAGKGKYDIEENFQMCPMDGSTLYYQVFFECAGKEYSTEILDMVYDAKEMTAILPDNDGNKTLVVENIPYIEPNEKEVEASTPEEPVEEETVVNSTPVYGEWSNWQETPIQATSALQVETKNVQEVVVTGSHKEFNYSYYSYMNNGTKFYTWSRDYAVAKGGSGEQIYRGWGKELFLHTLYDGTVWGSQYVDGGIWFYEEVREVQDKQTVDKTYYRYRTVTY